MCDGRVWLVVLVACVGPCPGHTALLRQHRGPLASSKSDQGASLLANHSGNASHHFDAQAFDKDMEAWWNEFLADRPMESTQLGDAPIGKWNDFSDAGQDTLIRRSEQRLANLEKKWGDALIRRGERDERTITLRVMQLKVSEMRRGYETRRLAPPIDPLIGIQSTSVSLLRDSHKIACQGDARAYLDRLWAYPSLFAPICQQLESAAQEKPAIVPYRVHLDAAVQDSNALLPSSPSDGPESNTLYIDFAQKLKDAVASKKLPSDSEAVLLQEAGRAVREGVWPAFRQLKTTCQSLIKLRDGKEDEGLLKVHGGPEFYRHRMTMFGDSRDPAELHSLGVKQVEDYGKLINKVATSYFETSNISLGQSPGHNETQYLVHEHYDDEGGVHTAGLGFSKVLAKLRETVWSSHLPNDEAGRQAYLAQQRQKINDINASLTKPTNESPPSQLFFEEDKPTLPLVINEVWSKTAPYLARFVAGNAASAPPTPSNIYFNVNRMELMPDAEMECYAYHEAIPGHHMQVALSQANKELPRFRRFFEFTPYSEGWAVYAEMQLGKRLGGYATPQRELGRLHRGMVISLRLVVDTGIHHVGWTRKQAEEYYLANSLWTPEMARKAVDRHLAMPGLAVAYGIGRQKFDDLRARATLAVHKHIELVSSGAQKTELWEARLHHELLKHGDLPLETLDRIVDDWIRVETYGSLVPLGKQVE